MKKSVHKNDRKNKYKVRNISKSEDYSHLNKYSDLLKNLLINRGLKDIQSIDSFLNPDYEMQTHNPFLFKDMDKAVDRILKAIDNGQKIVIYSDYDTDGIPGAVILHDFFKKIGFINFINYIPHRHDEGFGLNIDAVADFIEQKFDLIITIDCGITDIEAVNKATENGIDVIITDHHLPKDVLPKAFAIIDPKQEGCNYPEKMLCGSGVIFKVVLACIQRLREKNDNRIKDIKDGWEKWLLDMVGIATLSDMVPLLGENRVLAHYGLKVLRKSPRLGLKKLLSIQKVNQNHLMEDDIGFTIGPRINAASRMGLPMDAFRLLSTSDMDEAEKMANHLDKINNERKGIVAGMVREAKHKIKERFGDTHLSPDSDFGLHKVLVMGNPEWKPSLLGLVANSLAEEYEKPVFLWGRDGDGIIKGSCRSDGETNLVDLMNYSKDFFIQFGGHAFSGGFSVDNHLIHKLEDSLNEAFIKNSKAKENSIDNVNYVDSILTLNDVDWQTYKSIEVLAPFGVSNPKPIFRFDDIVPHIVKTFGKEKNHTEILFLKDNGDKVSAISFFSKPEDWSKNLDFDINDKKPITLIATFEKSMFRNYPELRLRIIDII